MCACVHIYICIHVGKIGGGGGGGGGEYMIFKKKERWLPKIPLQRGKQDYGTYHKTNADRLYCTIIHDVIAYQYSNTLYCTMTVIYTPVYIGSSQISMTL